MRPDERPGGGPRPLVPADHEMLRTLVRQRAGIVIDRSRDYFIDLRIAALAADEGFADAPALLEALRTEESWGVLHRRAAEALAIAETSWFRDVHPFEALRRQVVPELLHRRADRRELRIWSAACASGQEPYSVAMLLREHFPQLDGWRVRLLGSDFSAHMLRRTREGLYSQIEVNRGLPAQSLVRWFRREGLDWRLRDELRGTVELREINLTAPLPMLPKQDVVLLRNVLLYFDGPTRRAVLSAVHGLLADDGLLFLGGGETTLAMDDSFEPVTLGRSTAWRPRDAGARERRAA